MNKAEEVRITVIDASFCKNIFLLTQMIPPSVEFQQHFKKGMFQRPNTMGFLHVSHYLSIVYDAQLFQRMVRWPILCKKDEMVYRTQIKDFLSVLSQDNPDTNFPPILMSHLLYSAGTKFQTIMWKLSQLALKTYIKQQIPGELLLNAPCSGPMDNLAVTYFKSIIIKKCNAARENHEKTKRVLDAARNFLENEIELLNTYKSQIFDGKESIKRLVYNVSTVPIIRKRLMDIEDLDILNECKRNILEGFKYLCDRNKELSDLEECCDYMYRLVLRIKSNTEVFNANELPKINNSHYFLHVQPETQYSKNDLHTDSSVPFSTLLSLVDLASARMLRHVDTAIAPNLLHYLSCIRNGCENMKSLWVLFVGLNTRLSGILAEEQRIFREAESIRADLKTDDTFIASHRATLPRSLKISFNLDQYVDDNFFYEKLFSPPEGKHKDLFKRYRHKYYPLKASPVASMIDFNSSLTSGWSSPRAHSSKYEQTPSNRMPILPLYSRLLRWTKLQPKCSRENVLRSPSLSHEVLRPSKHRCSILEKSSRNLFNSL